MASLSAEPDPVTILFVDDEEPILRVIERLLVRSPYQVLTTNSPLRALEIIESQAVDVLVCDIDMPVMNGLDLLRSVRRTHPGILRMLLTGNATLERAMNAINEGEVVRFFTKPFHAGFFKSALDGLASRVEGLRHENIRARRRLRQLELEGWLKRRYPDLVDLHRNQDGELLLEPKKLIDSMAGSGAGVLIDLIRSD